MLYNNAFLLQEGDFCVTPVTFILSGFMYNIGKQTERLLAVLKKVYSFATDDAKHIEQLIDDDPVMINHIILPEGERLPEHYSNSNTYMVIIRGELTLQLNEQDPHVYTSGKIVYIPYKTKMNISNQNDQLVEFFIVKAPSPRNYIEA